jgi:regulator of protease activity HflC (stomatin/prohibitin superfamily)
VGEKQGISKDVLQPGWYFINPFEAKLSKIPIGCWEYNVKVEFDEVEVNGVKVKKPREGTGISVPTSDGKRIYLDVSVIWGNLPEYCPYNLEEYGQVEDIEKKVIAPQLDSICLSEGRNLSTLSFIQGQEREKFQSRIDGDMKRVCHEKKIVVHIVVIRDFYPDLLIRATLQAGKIAEEEKKTLEKEMVRDTVAAQLEKAKRIVATKVSDFDAETGKLVASEKALGQKEAAEKLAKAEQRVADLNKQAAEIMAEMVRISGKADADVVEAMKKADASKLVFEIQACGGAEQYNRITLADSLKDLQVRFIHTGPGTLWTNFSDLLKPDLEDVAAKKILEANQK